MNTFEGIKKLFFAVALILVMTVGRVDGRSTVSNFTTKLENDVVSGKDSRYTSGLEFTWFRSQLLSPSFDDEQSNSRLQLGSILLGDRSDARLVGTSVSFGQQFFTPEFVRTDEYLANDRPYAGWLYMNVGYHEKSLDTLRSISLTFGTVGADSFAEDTQRGVHQVIDYRIPEGWDNQIENELGVNLVSRNEKKIYSHVGAREKGFDLYTVQELVLGTVNQSARLGVNVNYGRGLPMSLNSSRIHNSGSPVFEARYSDYSDVPQFVKKRAYWTAGANVSYVSKNLFLEGNFDDDRLGITPEDLVGELEVGFVRDLKNVRLSFSYVFRTKEFEEQGAGQLFGSFAITLL